MNIINLKFTRDYTQIIKGIAILFMIVLHCFGGKGWYDMTFPEFENVSFMHFMANFKLCVGIFAFMIGFGYAFSKTKDFHYSIQHIWKLLQPYWIVCLIFALPIGYKSLNGITNLVLNLFGLESTLSWVCWFVYFYIYAMIVMPFLGRIIDKNIWYGPLLMGSCYLMQVAIHFIPWWQENPFTQALFNCFSVSSRVLLGYVFARYALYQKIPVPKHWSMPIISLICCCLLFLVKNSIPGTILGFSMDFFYTPIFIFFVLVFFNIWNLKYTSIVLIALGDASVFMWFFHGLFFTESTRWFYGRFITISDNIWIVTLWTIFLTYCCSWCLI